MWASRACVCRPAAGVVLRARPRLALGHAGPHVPAAFASTTAASSTPHTDCPFAILRIEPTEEFSKIKRAYFEAAARCHPDVMSAAALSKADPQATAQEFVLVTAAYQALQDPWTRTSLANTQPRARSAQTSSAAERRDTHGDTTWRREQQEMEWCVRRDACTLSAHQVRMPCRSCINCTQILGCDPQVCEPCRHEWRAKREEVMAMRQEARREQLAAAQRERLRRLSEWQAGAAGFTWAWHGH